MICGSIKNLSGTTERPSVNRKNIFVVAIAVPFIVELLQMVFGRSFDIDDLICNFIGIVVGFFIAYIIKDRKKEESKT